MANCGTTAVWSYPLPTGYDTHCVYSMTLHDCQRNNTQYIIYLFVVPEGPQNKAAAQNTGLNCNISPFFGSSLGAEEANLI